MVRFRNFSAALRSRRNARENLKHLAFVINGAPKIVRLAVDLDEHFVQVPSSLRKRLMMNAPLPDLVSKHWTESVPPEAYRLVADVYTPLEQQIFDLPQRQRIADVHHHREADHLGRTVEITEGIFHPQRLRAKPAGLNPICSDTAPLQPFQEWQKAQDPQARKYWKRVTAMPGFSDGFETWRVHFR